MRLVIQRVSKASVSVDDETTGSIEHGLLVLCGIHEDDDEAAAEWAAKKLLNIRLWEEPDKSGGGGKPWTRSALQNNFGVLLVSQFTLFATLKGNKPDFHRAMGPQQARLFWERFVARVQAMHTGSVQQGRFGAKMDVQLCNDGPVTILLDSPMPERPASAAGAAAGTATATVEPAMLSSAAVASSAASCASTPPATAATSPSVPRVLVKLLALGASTPLSRLQDRGLKLCALKTIRPLSDAAEPMQLAAVLQAPAGAPSSYDALAAVAKRCCDGCLVAEVSERWREVFAEAELLC
jgi:D-aminoacyl-tRNA deacylase